MTTTIKAVAVAEEATEIDVATVQKTATIEERTAETTVEMTVGGPRPRLAARRRQGLPPAVPAVDTRRRSSRRPAPMRLVGAPVGAHRQQTQGRPPLGTARGLVRRRGTRPFDQRLRLRQCAPNGREIILLSFFNGMGAAPYILDRRFGKLKAARGAPAVAPAAGRDSADDVAGIIEEVDPDSERSSSLP